MKVFCLVTFSHTPSLKFIAFPIPSKGEKHILLNLFFKREASAVVCSNASPLTQRLGKKFSAK